jgi:hypothetical protein
MCRWVLRGPARRPLAPEAVALVRFWIGAGDWPVSAMLRGLEKRGMGIGPRAGRRAIGELANLMNVEIRGINDKRRGAA